MVEIFFSLVETPLLVHPRLNPFSTQSPPFFQPNPLCGPLHEPYENYYSEILISCKFKKLLEKIMQYVIRKASESSMLFYSHKYGTKLYSSLEEKIWVSLWKTFNASVSNT